MTDIKIEESKLLNEKLAFSVKELAKALSVSPTTIYREMQEGNLLVTKLGGRNLFLSQNVGKWLSSLPTGQYVAP